MGPELAVHVASHAALGLLASTGYFSGHVVQQSLVFFGVGCSDCMGLPQRRIL